VSLRQTFIKHVGPAGLSSCRLHEWLAILRQNRFAVDVRYWPRAAFTTFNSVLNSFWSWREKKFDNDIANTKVPPPLIVLGIWRSGTTHLHNLLSKDDRFAFPTTYQALVSVDRVAKRGGNANVHGCYETNGQRQTGGRRATGG